MSATPPHMGSPLMCSTTYPSHDAIAAVGEVGLRFATDVAAARSRRIA